ncbi:flagellar motor switch protein FliN [Thermithiobacillus plumbiphilus]|uniref:Flagellar motor switch protein FliN n=1 Tax=Thermithiobacillus plumbiphilus TaxID=1729899 RepID=A0ABU9DC42_9PROT
MADNPDDILAELEAAGGGGGEASDMDMWEQALAEQLEAEQAEKPEKAEQAAPAASDGAAGVNAKPAKAASAPAKPAPFPSLQPEAGVQPVSPNLDLILDIPVTLSVELGHTKMQIRNLLQLAQGSVVELDRLAGEPMDVLVNGCLIAQGEVVVVNDKFGIRLTDIVSPAERVKKLR